MTYTLPVTVEVLGVERIDRGALLALGKLQELPSLTDCLNRGSSGHQIGPMAYDRKIARV